MALPAIPSTHAEVGRCGDALLAVVMTGKELRHLEGRIAILERAGEGMRIELEAAITAGYDEHDTRPRGSWMAAMRESDRG
jgi:hypothetical protein